MALEEGIRASTLLGKRVAKEDSFASSMSPIKGIHNPEVIAHSTKKARWEDCSSNAGELSPLSERCSWEDLDSPIPNVPRDASLDTIGDMVFLDEFEECDTEFLTSCVAEHLESEIAASTRQGLDKKQPLATDSDVVFYSAQKQKFALVKYVNRIVSLVSGSSSIFITALCLLQRAKKVDPLLAVHEFNVHRLWITAVVLASKMLEDEVYSNEHYARMGGVPSLSEMNRLEAAMLKKLNFSLYVPEAEYLDMRERVLSY